MFLGRSNKANSNFSKYYHIALYVTFHLLMSLEQTELNAKYVTYTIMYATRSFS